jgi:hypothetical protein
MTSIKVLLIFFSLLAAILSSVIFRARIWYRLLALLFFVVAAGFILFPDSTTSIAHVVGVGRGTDLLLYIALFAGVHGFLLMFQRTRRLERMLTDLIRAFAIRDTIEVGRAMDHLD